MGIGIRLLLVLLLLTGSFQPVSAGDPQDEALVALLRQRALPLKSEADLAPLLERTKKAKLVLLGDGSHGTYDFYRVRSHITQRLLLDHDFSFVAIEADWEAAAAVDRFVRLLPGADETAEEALAHLNIWPGWVWNNREMERLVIWLRELNLQRRPEDRIPIYGMDLLNFPLTVETFVLSPETSAAAMQLQACFTPFLKNLLLYPELLARGGDNCIGYVDGLRNAVGQTGSKLSFEASQRLRIIENGETYYRWIAVSEADAWNRRVSHFADSLEQFLAHHGDRAKGIVWAHNTHNGDASATFMADSGMQSLGEIMRSRFGPESLLLVGSTSYQGSVLASRQWGGPVEEFSLPPAATGSFEDILHQTGLSVAYWLFTSADRQAEPLTIYRGQRGVGVVYEPEFDTRDNYLGTLLPARYDALIFIDTTSALQDLE